MLTYLIRRLLYAPLIIAGVLLITFFLFFIYQTPEQAARNFLGKNPKYEDVQAWMHKRGYDKPLFLNWGQQPKGEYRVPYDSDGLFDTIFFNQIRNYATLNLGVSDVNDRDLTEIFKTGAIPSLAVMLPAYLVGFFMATGLALYLIFVRNSALDTAGVFVCVALMSIPPMVYIILGQVVAQSLNYFPAYGLELKGWSAARFLALPIALVVIFHLGHDTRLYRAVFLEEIGQDYVRTARAKGVSNARVLLVHVLKNGMIALITLVVAGLPLVILGSILVESFFGIPGLGNLLVTSIQNGDRAVIAAVTFLTSVLYIIGLTLTDICYALVDPRIRLS